MLLSKDMVDDVLPEINEKESFSSPKFGNWNGDDDGDDKFDNDEFDDDSGNAMDVAPSMDDDDDDEDPFGNGSSRWTTVAGSSVAP